ncbi:MAG: DUF2303 family protein [Verrucomicrobia bacterium]|nr:DUF2303 family protein [Verrucomicrobiota bacterium]
MKSAQILASSENLPEAAVAAALALEIHQPDTTRFEPAKPDRPALLIAQPGLAIHSLEQFAETPHRPTVVVELDSAKDLHSYVNAQTSQDPVSLNHNTVIFASRTTQAITAFLDYHHKDAPRWLNHRANVQYLHSHQFKRWLDMNNKHMTQEQFALFIDEMLPDFENPTGAEMLSFATCLEAHSNQVFKSATTLASGETQFIFTDDRKGDVSTKIIAEFNIAVPVWQNGERILITAKLYHRLVDNKDSANVPTGTKSLRFWYTLRQVERIIDELFKKEVEFLQTAFNGIATLYNGTAPAIPSPMAHPAF